VDKHIGDNVMAVFGAPVAHADDPERALRAALNTHRSMAALSEELGRELQAHIGIASGQVVASGTGSNAYRETSRVRDPPTTGRHRAPLLPQTELMRRRAHQAYTLGRPLANSPAEFLRYQLGSGAAVGAIGHAFPVRTPTADTATRMLSSGKAWCA